MAKSTAATVETGEPNEFYDSLSQEAKDQWDAIGILGYTPDKGAAGLWFARKSGQKAAEAIGPADSLQSLKLQVKDFEDNKPDENGNIELKEDSKGQAYIPGTAPIVNKDLVAAARDHFNKKTTRMEWTDKEKEAKDHLDYISRQNENLFTVDPDTGKKTYIAGDIEVEWAHEIKDNFKTRLVTKDDED